jgi:hypothetical protein
MLIWSNQKVLKIQLHFIVTIFVIALSYSKQRQKNDCIGNEQDQREQKLLQRVSTNHIERDTRFDINWNDVISLIYQMIGCEEMIKLLNCCIWITETIKEQRYFW